MNLILSDVEETITLVDVGDDGGVANVRVSRCSPVLSSLTEIKC